MRREIELHKKLLNFSDLLATGNGTFNNGQMNGSGGSASNFPSVGNFEIGTFNISNSSRGGGKVKMILEDSLDSITFSENSNCWWDSWFEL